jgi:hypothetical protein
MLPSTLCFLFFTFLLLATLTDDTLARRGYQERLQVAALVAGHNPLSLRTRAASNSAGNGQLPGLSWSPPARANLTLSGHGLVLVSLIPRATARRAAPGFTLLRLGLCSGSDAVAHWDGLSNKPENGCSVSNLQIAEPRNEDGERIEGAAMAGRDRKSCFPYASEPRHCPCALAPVPAAVALPPLLRGATATSQVFTSA